MGKGSSVTNTSTVTSNTQPPQQFEDALTSALGTAQAVGQTPYSNYPGQLQAPFSPQQQEAFGLVGSTPGISAPYINAAAQYINAATTPLQPTIQPYANQAQQYIGQAAGTNLLGSVQPYINQAQQYTGQAAGTNLLGSVQPYINQAEGNVNAATGTNLGAAVNPYLNQAQQYFGQAQNLYGQNAGNAANFNVSPYMNPYVNSVVNATQAQFNNQNQQQQAQLAGNAASAGALGGSREGVAQGVLAGQQQLAQAPVIAGLYNQGFGQAQQEFNSQQQAAQSAAAGLGSLGQGQLGAGQESLGANLGQAGLYNTAATTLGSLGQQALGANLGQAGLYNTAATTSGALGQQALGATSGQAGLYNTAAGGLTNIGGQLLGANEANAWLNSQAGFGMANLGNQALNSTLTSANALAGAGATQQAQAQQGLNIPYEQWIAQQSYPFQTAGWESGLTGQLSNAAGGTASTTSPGPDPFSQIAGLGLGATGVVGATGGFGSGGWLTGLLNGGAGSGAAATAAGIGGLGGVSNIAALGAGTADAVSSFDAADLLGLGFNAFGVPAPARGGAISAYLKKAQRAAGGSVPKAPSNTGPVNVTLQPSTKGQGFGVPMMQVDRDKLYSFSGGFGNPGSAASVNNYLNTTAATANPIPAAAPAAAPVAAAPVAAAPVVSPTNPFNVPPGSIGIPGIDPSAGALDFGQLIGSPGGGGKRGGRAGGFADGGDVGDFSITNVPAMDEDDDPYRHAPSPAGDPNQPIDPYRAMPSQAGFGLADTGGLGRGPPAPPPPARDTGEPMTGGSVSRETRSGLGSSAAGSIRDVPRGANPWLSVADAGFAMAAGKSPHALENIGAGLQHGVESYMTHDQAAQALAARVDEARARLADTQSYRGQNLNVREDAIAARSAIAARTAELRSQGLGQEEAYKQAQIEIQRGNQGIAQQRANTGDVNANTNQNRAVTSAAQRDDQIAVAKARLSMTQADQQQRAQARANASEDQAALKIFGDAQFNNKPISYADALAKARAGRVGAGNAPVPVAPQAADPLGIR